MNLNGFEILKYNQYDLPEGKKYSTCPLCSAERKKKTDKCMMLDWSTGIGTCQHCSEIIQLHTYKKKEQDKVYAKPEWINNTELDTKVVKWFEGRKISQFTLRRLQVTSGSEWMPQTKKDENVIKFNYFRDNEIVNIKYRDGRKHFKMVTNAQKIPYNLDNIRTTKEAIIVEGEIDVLSFVECGVWNVVSSPNGSTTGSVNLDWLDDTYEYFENKEKIYLALDNDEPGQNVQKELIRRLGAERCYLINLSSDKLMANGKKPTDTNDLLVLNNKEYILELIENAIQCPLENVEKYNDVKQDLHNFYLNGSAPGYGIGIPNFDNIFTTYTKQYIVVTGIPTHGKSDFVDQMTVGYNMKYDWKIAYVSPENKPTYLHVDKIARKIAGFKPRTEIELNSYGWTNVEERINNNFYFVEYEDGYDLRKSLQKGAELVKRKGIKCLVIDPFNKIRLKESWGKGINEYTADYLIEIDDFCRKYDCLVILVAHPVKMNKQNGVTPEPDFYSIKGGGEFYDMSYHGILVHRNFDNQTTKVKVLKVKFQNLGTNQAECYFKWNINNGRYTKIEGDPSTFEIDMNVNWDNSNWMGLPKKEDIQELKPETNFYNEIAEDRNDNNLPF